MQKMTALARVVYRSSSLHQNCTAVFTEIEKTVLLLIRKHKETLIAAAILSRKSNVQVRKLVWSYSAEPESQKLGLEQSHKQTYKPVLQNIKPGNEIKQVQHLVFYSSPKHAREKKNAASSANVGWKTGCRRMKLDPHRLPCREVIGIACKA